jgi:hypothetical protein
MLYRIGACAIALSLLVALPLAAQEEEAGFTPLFDGKDLAGWEIMGTQGAWSVQDGTIYCSGEGVGYLRSKEQYTDFELRLDYKIAPRTNSGIFLRAAEQGNPGFSGMELQIMDDAGRPPDSHSTMSVYAAVAPTKNPAKPAGEWNSVDVTLKGMHLTVVLNGETVIDRDLSDPNIDTEGHPKLTDRAKTGYIGLQDHGGVVWFRDIRIKKLP